MPIQGITGLITEGTAVTPDNNNDISTTAGLYVGVEGDISVIFANATTPVTLKNASGFLPIMVTRVLYDGTTATDIVALY